MARSLMLVESPTKARTIKRYLGKRFDVEATMGHIKDLPKTTIGVDLENGFKLNYRVKPDKRDLVKRLKKLANSADEVYLASDPDREGEAIAWHVAEELSKSGKKVRRITFHEITKNAIEEAVKNPRGLDSSLYNAQMARRAIDRIVGYTMSPLLWKRVKRGLSAGRVQSVALSMICAREEEIEAFIPREFWTVEALLETQNHEEIIAKVVKPKDIATELEAKDVARQIESTPKIVISGIVKRKKKRNPSPPFITSTLQQEASRRLRFSAKKTMVIAQQLYEGIQLGSMGPEGLITYMRTDSPVISTNAMTAVRGFIQSSIGKEYLPDKPNVYKAKKTAQEAHEAIRPTDVHRTPDTLKDYLDNDQLRLYELIWKRFVASQMKSAVFEQTTVDIDASGVKLRATGSVLLFDGYMKVYNSRDTKDKLLPKGLSKGQLLKLVETRPEQHFTQPPARYTEATLIKELEEKGIGRPSTYAPTISTIQERGYVKKDKGVFLPTELGRDVSRLLVKNYPNIINVGFTARMEDTLDEIEEGKKTYVESMEAFYSRYIKEHSKAEKEMENLKTEPRPSGIKCDLCGREMLIKIGRNGYFLGCSGYPECRNTKDFTRDEKGNIVVIEPPKPDGDSPICDKCGSPMVVKHGKYGPFLACSNYPECKNTRPIKTQETTDKLCDKCGAPMVVKHGKYGPFLACSNYPECKNIMPYTIGLSCPVPGCNGEITIRRTKKGRTFYACSNDKCDFVAWSKPVEKKCPLCGVDFLLRKGNKLICPNPKCSYEEPEQG